MKVSKKTDWPKGGAEQLSGDFYAACMDENRIDALGVKPLQPMLDEVRAIKTKNDVQRTIEHLHDIGIAAPFGLFAAQDLHNPKQMIAHVTASGLGLPDRDYYLKTEKRFQKPATNTKSTSRTCSNWPARSRRNRKRLRKPSSSSKSGSPENRWTTWPCAIP